MSLSDFEIKKITEIVAGKMGANLDAKEMRRVIDSVVDKLKETQGNPEITGVTCEVSSIPPGEASTGTNVPDINIQGPSSPLPSRSSLTSYDDTDNDTAGLYQQIEKTDKSRIIIATFGKNRPGVVAAITEILASNNCSIEDISQTLMQEFFSMIMVVNISGSTADFETLRNKLKETESRLGMKVYVMHEDIFQYMHRI